MNFLRLEATGSPAVVDPSGRPTLSFTDLVERAGEIAALFGSAKSLVLLATVNDPFSVVVYTAAMLGGHVVAFVDAGSAPGDLALLVNAYRPTWIAGPRGLVESLTRGDTAIPAPSMLGDGLVARTAFEHPVIHPDLSVMLSTSGTTGSRKFVRLSRRNLESNAESIAAALGLTEGERPMTSLPIHYSFGLSVLNSHWWVGAPVVLTNESILQRSFWEGFERLVCTSLAGVPYTYQMLERIGFRDMTLPSLTSLQQAGGALDRRLTDVYETHMRGRGGRFFVMYGQTEATARIACVPPGRLPDKIGSAGLPIPNGRIWIDAGDDTSAPQGTTGEVVYEGPNVMMGYAIGADDLGRGDDQHGVLRTGDIGYLDPEGYLYLVGRSKRIAKVFGRRVNLDEVEAIARENGPAAVVAGEDAVIVVCGFGTPEAVASLGSVLAQRLGLHPSAVRTRWVETIPTTPSGKVDYEQVQRWIG